MRLSSIQQDILFLLYAIEQKGFKEPVASMKLFNMINSSRSSLIADTNFRASCHTLSDNEMVDKYRCPTSLKLSWSLSEIGRSKANKVYKNRTAVIGQISSNYIVLIIKPCLARNLELLDNKDGTVTIDGKKFTSTNDVEELLNNTTRKDLSKNGKNY